MMFSKQVPKTFGTTKKEYISVSIVMPTPPKEISAKKSVSSLKPTIVPAVEASKNTRNTTAKNVDVSDLFSDVWTKKISHKTPPPKVSKNLLYELNKKSRVDKNKKVFSSLDSLDSKIVTQSEVLSIDDLNSSAKIDSSGEQINEYLAKINSIVYKHFSPPQNSQGHSVKSVIELNALGKVIDFRILTYSANEALNRECDSLKSRLSSVVFPIHPEGRESRTVIILTSKE